jgi:hypothetical protein
VKRARITQVMRLRHLVSDIQEQILFLPTTTFLKRACAPERPGLSQTLPRGTHVWLTDTPA